MNFVLAAIVLNYVFVLQFNQIVTSCDCESNYQRYHPCYVYHQHHHKKIFPVVPVLKVPTILHKVHNIVGSSLDLAASAASGRNCGCNNNIGGCKRSSYEENIIKSTITSDNDCRHDNDDDDCCCNDNGGSGGGDLRYKTDLTWSNKCNACDKDVYEVVDDCIKPIPIPIPIPPPPVCNVHKVCHDVLCKKSVSTFQKNASIKRKFLCRSIAKKREQLAALAAKLNTVQQNCDCSN